MKRIFDLVVSALGLIFCLPVMAIVALAIKSTSPGPVIFRQKRLTIGMREFTIYKFRTMLIDFDKEAKGIQISGVSTAITAVGRILRKTKLDEIPQFFNILMGDMSFVGPRPELPRRLRHYTDDQKSIFTARSGVTSPASIVFSDEEFLLNGVPNPEEFYIQFVMPYKIK